eukprot:6202659-Pleurochrysis_carterae.AAC.3
MRSVLDSHAIRTRFLCAPGHRRWWAAASTRSPARCSGMPIRAARPGPAGRACRRKGAEKGQRRRRNAEKGHKRRKGTKKGQNRRNSTGKGPKKEKVRGKRIEEEKVKRRDRKCAKNTYTRDSSRSLEMRRSY